MFPPRFRNTETCDFVLCNVSVNHQQVVIQPTSKHIKCIFDTKSFHLVLPLTKAGCTQKKTYINLHFWYLFAFLTSVIIKRRTVSFPIIFSYFYSIERKALWTFVFLFFPNSSFLQRLFSGCKRSKGNSWHKRKIGLTDYILLLNDACQQTTCRQIDDSVKTLYRSLLSDN